MQIKIHPQKNTCTKKTHKKYTLKKAHAQKNTCTKTHTHSTHTKSFTSQGRIVGLIGLV